ncbi:MAG: M42 family metallopeptidase [Ruminococcaceae bacterium]|nr:M42 family metallopeptidase [Oscillospiraceae bacterium]
MRDTLKQLCAAMGPSGFECTAADIAADLLRPLVDEVSVDRLGNVIGVKRCGKPDAKRLVLDAHLDEIGLIVTGIEEGFLRFTSIGGVDPRVLPGRELMVLADKPLPGVVICTPPHILTAEGREKSIPIDELYIDIGLSQQQAEAAVPVGTPVVYRESCFCLGKNQMCGKAMDDRACFAALLRTMERLQDKELDVDVYVLGSTFEEVGGAGAKTGVYSIDPDWCVAVDVTHGKTPDSPKEKVLKMGGGPAIGVGPNMTRWMTQRLKDKAKALDIPFQLEVMGGHTGTNAWPIQICREGIATALVSLPLKYMHTPTEVLDLSDVEHLAQLLAEFAVGLGEEGQAC